MKKKLMLLGGSRYLLPAIEAAHKLGAYVITCDFLPNNYAHKFSDEYCNISLLDTPALLAKAKELGIDGILGFANDIGVLPAAVIATEMGLPTPPLKSVEILQNKDKFRDFLEKNGFNCPWHYSFDSKDAALEVLGANEKGLKLFPCIVKPVDSCGSKGCTRVDNWASLPAALDEAFAKCYNGKIIVEQFLELDGYQSGSDSYSINGELCFCTFDSQTFDKAASNPYTPAAHIWPSFMPQNIQTELRGEIERLVNLLNIGTSVYNIEARLAKDGKAYIMEVSPRTGGNRLAEVLVRATGQDLIENNVRFALGFEQVPMRQPTYDGAWAVYVVHSMKAGVYCGISINPEFAAAHVKACDMYIEPGTRVEPFTGANQAIGTVFLRFDSNVQAKRAIERADEWLTLNVA